MNRPDAERFFRSLLASAPDDAAVVVTAFPTGESIALSADNFEGLATAAQAAVEARQDAYFSVCCVGTDFVAARGRGKKPDYRCAVALWADLDVRSPAHKAAPETLPPTAEDAAALLEDVGIDPTLLVSSGHGLHAYFVLDAPVIFGAGGGLSAEGLHFAAVCEAFQGAIRDAAAKKGWHVDIVADVPRVLRVPGTMNFKITSDVRPVELLLDGGPRCSFGDIAEVLGLTREAPRGKIGAVAPPASGAHADGAPTTPDAAATVSASGVPSSSPVDVEDVKDRLRNLRSVTNRKFFAPILEGKSFAKPGERDRLMQRAASLVAFVEPDADPKDLAEIFRPSFDVWAAEPGATRSADDEVEKAIDKIRRAQQDKRRKQAQTDAVNERLRAKFGMDQSGPPAKPVDATPQMPAEHDDPPPGFAPCTRESPHDGPCALPLASTSEAGDGTDKVGAGDPDVASNVIPVTRLTAAPPVAPGFAPYTEEELDAIANDLGCHARELGKRWIIQHKSAYFVLVDGRYKRPITDKELDVSLPRDLKRSPVEFWIPKANDADGLRPAKTSEILRSHATVARTLVSSLSAQRSAYEAETETFVEAVCPVRPIEPRFDQDVQDWLEAFFGDEAEKGLDWVATSTDLDRYTCALYLSGPPETGKTLFAGGISRLWTIGGPSELGRILENFNEDLIRCPLIFADEHIPVGSRGHRTSTELRNLIGNNRRTLNRKFLPQAPLVGAIRLVLAANNDRLLAFSEDLSAHDLEAVAERFLHVNTARAQGFFRRFPGNKAPEDWVDGDTIAAHALYLRDNRVVNHDGRFLVAGSRSKMLSMLATSGRAAPVVEWLVKFLMASPQIRQPIDNKKLVLVGKGNFYVNTLAVADSWDLFVQNDRAQSTNKIGRTLAGLSDGQEHRIGGTRYHKIDHELVLAWAAENQVGDVDLMRARIEQ